MLDVFVRCGDHAPFYNLFNVTLKNLDMFNVNSSCHLHSFFARCFYPIVEFFVLRNQKRNKLPTTKLLLLDQVFVLKLCIIFLILSRFYIKGRSTLLNLKNKLRSKLRSDRFATRQYKEYSNSHCITKNQVFELRNMLIVYIR